MIRLERVTKRYRTSTHRRLVLDDVTTVFDSSICYGLLGHNGAGKSTLLRIIAGSELPNSGRVVRGARISWPLGFAGGFHPEMTGRENLVFLANVYGASSRAVTDFVVDFAELGEYLDAPVGTFSSGMQARLAFAVSMAIDFECYLVDEITAVGDARFQQRCANAFAQRRKRSGMIMASHDVATMKAYCSAGFVLANGKLIDFDDIDEAIEFYKRSV
jgi:capsular polysaccharide transport system ATP-binding protein